MVLFNSKLLQKYPLKNERDYYKVVAITPDGNRISPVAMFPKCYATDKITVDRLGIGLFVYSTLNRAQQFVVDYCNDTIWEIWKVNVAEEVWDYQRSMDMNDGVHRFRRVSLVSLVLSRQSTPAKEM